MIRALALVAGTMVAGAASAQAIEWQTLRTTESEERAASAQMSSGIGARLRGLDKVSGALTDLMVLNGDVTEFGRLRITVGDCRYPSDNPESEAFAWLTITDLLDGEALFSGWMIASSPALNALDHARYDVWVLECDRVGG